jgi:hypothetical protein
MDVIGWCSRKSKQFFTNVPMATAARVRANEANWRV